MRRIAFAFVTLALPFSFAGCAGSAGEEGSTPTDNGGVGGDITYVEVNSPNGKIPCIVWQAIQEGGLSCHWPVDTPDEGVLE